MSFNFIWMAVSMVMIFIIFVFTIVSRDTSEYVAGLYQERANQYEAVGLEYDGDY